MRIGEKRQLEKNQATNGMRLHSNGKDSFPEERMEIQNLHVEKNEKTIFLRINHTIQINFI